MKILWTDGSAEPNPGPGGFAVIEVSGGEGRPVVLGADERTTNIRMEGKAIIAAMEYAGEEGCEIYTDSQFWINVLTKWAPGWERVGWRKRGGEVKNKDLVVKMYYMYMSLAKQVKIRLCWVRGHAGTKYNEMADEWASKARLGEKL